MDALFHLRDMIASLDVPLTDDLCARARLPRNEALYALNGGAAPAPGSLAGAYAQSTTLAGRVLLLRPFYVHTLLPTLCAPGGSEADRNACLAADTACLNSLARRLALSIHVATRKREALPDALQAALRTGDPARVEEAITNLAVEADVIARVEARARKGGANDETVRRLADLYANALIPLSRQIQVHGLLADG
jgi:chorismate mutase